MTNKSTTSEQPTLFTLDRSCESELVEAETLNPSVNQRGCSSEAERRPHTTDVPGSIPGAPTIFDSVYSALSAAGIASFWQKVARGADNECWPWQGCVNDKGYGRFRRRQAHRFAYAIAKGPIPLGLICRHSCDNPPCCNPAHICLGTHQENSDDAIARGRKVRGARVAGAKLTEDRVAMIRANPSGLSVAEMSRRFGVSECTIRNIIDRVTWKYVRSAA